MKQIIEAAKRIDAPAIVAGAAFLASAGHIVSVVDATNPLFFALAYPIGIDGLLYVGIKAMRERRYVVGTIGLLIGAFFSLAFNAHAENALRMDPLLIAASMPVCLLAAFVIEHIGSKAVEIVEIEKIVEVEKIVTETVEVEKIVTVLPDLLPIVPLAPKSKPEPKKTETKKDAPRTQAGAGRVAAWDVEKAVRLHADGRTDEDVLLLVDGLTAKPWQRTKRAIKIITQDASATDESVAGIVGQSAAHVARIRAAMKGNA